jgi:hypothetical protein
MTSIETEPSPRPEYRERGKTIAWCVFFAVFAYSAHFFHSGSFGLYEDDYYTVPIAATSSAGQLWDYVVQQWKDYPHGRPVGWSLWRVIPWIGFRLGNLGAVYALSGAIVAANCVLLFLLLRRAWGDRLAILGGLAYTLCPADTCRQMLVHANLLQVSVLFFMIAAHCSLSRRWWLRWIFAYVFCALILLTYESMFLPFLLVPLMTRRWDRQVIIRWVIHGAVCMVLIAAATAVRMKLGEGRLVQSTGDGEPLPLKVLRACLHGPTVSMPLWIERIGFTLDEAAMWGVQVVMVVGFMAIAAALLAGPVSRHDRRPERTAWLALLQPLLVGVAMLYGSYAFAITPDHYLKSPTYGRVTSVHMAAAVGSSIVLAVLLEALLLASQRVRWMRATATVVVAAYFAVLLGFAFIVQKGFVSSAVDQRAFWTRVLRLCPDIDGGDVILMEGRIPQGNWFALTSSWSDPLVLPLICQVPHGRPPVLVVFADAEGWKERVVRDGDKLRWRLLPGEIAPQNRTELLNNDLIVLRRIDDRVQRIQGPVEVHGVTVQIKPKPPEGMQPVYKPGPVYPLLIKDRNLPPEQQFPGLKGPVLEQ